MGERRPGSWSRSRAKSTPASTSMGRGSRIWVKVQDGARRWVQEWHSGYGSKKEAKAARDKLLGERDHGAARRKKSKVTVAAYMAEWLDGLVDVRPSTAHGYRKVAEGYIVPNLGAVPLQALTTTRINTFYGDLYARGGKDGKGLSPRSIEHCHGALRRALPTPFAPGSSGSTLRLKRHGRRNQGGVRAAVDR